MSVSAEHVNDVLSEPGGDIPEPQAEPVVQAAPEPAQPAPDKPKDDPKVVGILENLRDEREKRQTSQAEAAALRERLAQFEQLKAELDEQRKAKQAQAEQERFNENPAAYLKQQVDGISQKIEQQGAQTQAERQQAEEQMRFHMAVSSQIQAFKKQTPDYTEAVNFLKDRRSREYEALGYTTDQIDSLFDQEAIGIAKVAIQNGKNPGEVAYTLAKMWGYSGAKQPDPKQDNEAALKRLEQGVKASQTLSGAGHPEEQSLLKKVEDMSDDEFDKFWKQEVQPKGRH